MSAFKVTDKVLRAVDQGDTDIFIVNFATPDMVGHTGKLAPTMSLPARGHVFGWINKGIRQSGE